jgi:type IV pilus assembly protein PilE
MEKFQGNNQNYIQVKGFTLIELMIVMVIIGVLAAIAYPSYQSHLQKSRRVDAQTAMLELAQYMERYYTTNGSYTGAALPFTASPKDDATKYYALSLSAQAANSYTLSGAPSGTQATDSCGTLTLNHTGAKTPTTSGCWN